MHTFRRRWAAAVALAGTTACASPAMQATDCARFSDDQVAQALRFAAGANSWAGYAMPEQLPRVEYWPAGKIARLPGAAGQQATGAFTRTRDDSVTVVLVCQPKIDAQLHGILAHELVHYLQHNAGEPWPLPEGPARSTQGLYMIMMTPEQ